MACISKLNIALLFDCESGFTGIQKACMVNMADIDSMSFSSFVSLSSITLTPNAKAVVVDCVKKSLVVTETLRANDGAPNAFSHEAVINIFNKNKTPEISNAIANGSFVLFCQYGSAAGNFWRVYGLRYGLAASASSASSHDNGGWTQITISTPDGVLGEDAIRTNADTFNSLYNNAINE